MARLSTHGRRRRSFPWTLWKVSPHRANASGFDGFLVTTADRLPLPIAYVAGTDSTALGTALAIRHRGAVKGVGVQDLRGCKLQDNGLGLPEFLYGVLLWPVDRRGRIIANSATYAGGLYGKDRTQEWFALFTHGSDAAKLRPLGRANKPQTVPTLAPKLGGRKSKEAKTAAAKD